MKFHPDVEPLTVSQRAMLVAHAMAEARLEARETAIEKDAWISSARKLFKPGTQQPCSICAGYAAVTHAHHITPLSRQFDAGYSEPDHTYVWLCPTHHAGVHLFLTKRASWPRTTGFTAQEVDHMIQLALAGLVDKEVTGHAA